MRVDMDASSRKMIAMAVRVLDVYDRQPLGALIRPLEERRSSSKARAHSGQQDHVAFLQLARLPVRSAWPGESFRRWCCRSDQC